MLATFFDGPNEFFAAVFHETVAKLAKHPAVPHTDCMHLDLTGTQLRPATTRDWLTLADITAEAFANDPVNNYVFGKQASIRSMYRVMAREMYVPSGLCHLHASGGATMWMPPGVEAAPSEFGLMKFALGQLRHGTFGAIKRGLALSELMQAWHPKDPHFYLFAIGTTLQARGKGVGKDLLRPVLAACDTAKMPVYLENSNPNNTGFYASHGFERMGLFNVGEDDSPLMEPMWREPKEL